MAVMAKQASKGLGEHHGRTLLYIKYCKALMALSGPSGPVWLRIRPVLVLELLPGLVPD